MTNTYAEDRQLLLRALTFTSGKEVADTVLRRFERAAEQGGIEDREAGERAVLGGLTLNQYAVAQQERLDKIGQIISKHPIDPVAEEVRAALNAHGA